jgi:hypothetical protein
MAWRFLPEFLMIVHIHIITYFYKTSVNAIKILKRVIPVAFGMKKRPCAAGVRALFHSAFGFIAAVPKMR